MIADIITEGFGSFTSIAFTITMGYGDFEAIVMPDVNPIGFIYTVPEIF